MLVWLLAAILLLSHFSRPALDYLPAFAVDLLEETVSDDEDHKGVGKQ